jgi:hypothetical protein
VKQGFTFRNTKDKQYEVVFRKPNKHQFGPDCDGVCTNPSKGKPRITINPYRTDQTVLNTSIHEFAHAFFWDKSEREVKRFADAMSRFLYNHCGWRKK